MKRRHAIVAGLAAGVMASAGVLAAAARPAPSPQPYGRPIGPAMASDTGAGELLIAVVGGVFDDRREAEAANEAMSFGDLQGYFVVPVAQFQGFRQGVGELPACSRSRRVLRTGSTALATVGSSASRMRLRWA